MINNAIKSILILSRMQKRLIALLFDFVFLSMSLILSVALNEKSFVATQSYWFITIMVVALNIAIFAKLGLYNTVLRFISIKAITTVAAGVTLSSIFLCLLSLSDWFNFSPLVSINFWCFSLIGVGATRLAISTMIQNRACNGKEPIIIYGAGSSGRQLYSALVHGDEYNPVAFIDDDPSLQNTHIQGVPVIKLSKLRSVIDKHEITKVLLAITNTTRTRRKQILDKLEPFSVKVQTIPDFSDIVTGRSKIEEIKDIEIEDLLGRDTVAPDKTLLEKCVLDKVVMVTGAGGSIGSELCRQIVKLRPKSIILFELSEYALYAIEKELRKSIEAEELKVNLVPFLGSIQHKKRLTKIMATFKVNTVYHAAAYKHVPIVEHNIIEGVRNNVFGTSYTAEAAIAANVETFVLISTDKAVRPTNFMGTTKRLAELSLQALQTTTTNTKFCMVRFGNVLGSSGSVVPLFREQIRKGGPVTVTHPEITRFFMTIPEAAELVIQASALAKGGEVFVLDMGDCVKINELAKKMIRLMGLEVKEHKDDVGDIEIVYSGLRPGEKLYEELLIGDNVEGSSHPRIMCAREDYLPQNAMQSLLKRLDQASHNFDYDLIRKLLIEAPTSFEPSSEMCDWLYQEKSDESYLEHNLDSKISWLKRK